MDEPQHEIIEENTPDTTISPELSDEMLLSDLTVGQFKQLLHDLLVEYSGREVAQSEVLPTQPQVTVRRKSLDEFMSDLTLDK